MGSSNGDSDERPVHAVTVSGFSISKYPITQKEWSEVMGTTIQQQRDAADRSGRLAGVGDNHPIYYVNWYEAVDYCNKRSVMEGLTPAYRGSRDNITCDWNANGYRLPTEAEWEFAAKGGTRDLMALEYSGSNSVEAVAWHNENSEGSAYPVGSKAPNSLGLYDMSGNVYEWCWDKYGSYSRTAQTDPKGSTSSRANNVRRGGGWSSDAYNVRSTNRSFAAPANRYDYVGFRVVRP